MVASNVQPLVSLMLLCKQNLGCLRNAAGPLSSPCALREANEFFMPWISTLLLDMAVLYKYVADVRRELPYPNGSSFMSWWTYVEYNKCRWQEFVNELFFSASILDRTSHTDSERVVGTCACDICSALFSTAKALAPHKRVSHKVRSCARYWAGSDLMCKACSTIFSNRPRLIAYLTDSRRQKCLSFLRSSVPKLLEE